MRIFGLGHRHLGAETLNEYLDDRLSAAAGDRVRQVVAGCPDCGLELTALQQTRLLLRQLPEVAPRRSFFISPSDEPTPAHPATTWTATTWLRLPQWAYAGTASLAALALTLMIVVDATGLVAPGRTTEQASNESPASSQSQQESSPVMMDSPSMESAAMESPAMESAALTESLEPASAVSTTVEVSEAAQAEDESLLMTDSPPPTESVEAAEAVSTAQEISERAPPRDKSLVKTDSSTPMASAQAKSVPPRSIEATAKEAAVDKEAARGKDTGEAASFPRADRSDPEGMAATETESQASEATTDSQPEAIVPPTFAPPDGALEQQAKVAATPEALSSAPEENDVSGELPVEATTTAETAGVENPGRVDEMTEDDTLEAVPESEDAAVGDLGPPSQEGTPPSADADNPTSRALLLWRGLEGLTAVLALAFTTVWIWKRREARR